MKELLLNSATWTLMLANAPSAYKNVCDRSGVMIHVRTIEKYLRVPERFRSGGVTVEAASNIYARLFAVRVRKTVCFHPTNTIDTMARLVLKQGGGVYTIYNPFH